MDTSSLKEAGLTDGEIKVYLALLELGSSTTGPIVDKSGIARSIIYQILEKLMQKGIVSVITKEKTKYFQAAEPSKLLEYIEERKVQLEDNRRKVEAILPQLLLKQQIGPKSTANLYFGFRGIRTAHEHHYPNFKRGDEYYHFGIPVDQPEVQLRYWERDHIRRIKAGFRCKLLFNAGTPPAVLRKRNSYPGAEARYMPVGLHTPAGIGVYGDRVTIYLQNIDNPLCVEIVNRDIANSFKAYFDEFWKKSKPFKR